MQIIYLEDTERSIMNEYLPPSLRHSRLPGQLFYAAVDEQSETAVGLLAAQVTGNRLDLLWICVADDWRHRGVGTLLIETLLHDASRLRAIEAVSTLCVEGSAVAGLLNHCGFALETAEAGEYRLTLSHLSGTSHAFWEKTLDARSVFPLAQVPALLLREFNAYLAEQDNVPFSLPLNPEHYDKQLSLYHQTGKKIDGVLLMQNEDGVLYLRALFANHTGSALSPAAILLNAVATRAKKLYPPETEVRIASIAPTATALIENLLPEIPRSGGVTAKYAFERE